MKPRPVHGGRTYLITRRCSERRFFLRPDDDTNNAFWYCLGWAALRHGMLIHAAVAMSNHVHVVLTDPDGRYPVLLRDFLSILARCMNAQRGRWEHFWDANQASVVHLEGEAAQLDKLVYTLTNPVGLVEHAHSWPGATALQAILHGGTIVATKPRHFFRDCDNGGELPETLTVNFTPPPTLANLEREDYARLVEDRVKAVEKQRTAERAAQGKSVLGRRHILDQHWNARPADSEPRRQVSPGLACRDKWRRIELLQRSKAFLAAHEAAFQAFRAGLRAVFPLGTWLMRQRASIVLSTA